MSELREPDYFCACNSTTRIEIFDELSEIAKAALYAFFRRIEAVHLIDEVVLPLLSDGDSQIFAAVRDRPWPPWGLGARNIVGVLQTHLVADGCWALSPVHVGDEDLTNVGLAAALYKEALETLSIDPQAEINYLVVEGSRLADTTLRRVGFEKTEDVFLTEAARYLTYRAPVDGLLSKLGLDRVDTVDILANGLDDAAFELNAALHSSIYLGSRAEWTIDRPNVASELARLVRGGHYSKPGGVPTGTGRYRFNVDPDYSVVQIVRDFLETPQQQALLEYCVEREQYFRPATIIERGSREEAINQSIRSSQTLNDLGEFEVVLVDRIREQLEEVRARLGHPAFPLGRIELQATASGDRDYFRIHRDSDGDDTRELTFVYFFFAEPRRFSGGELRVFETEIRDGELVSTDKCQTVVPRSNVAVFFPSRHDHEVLPVRVPSEAFSDGRFSITGWVHRK